MMFAGHLLLAKPADWVEPQNKSKEEGVIATIKKEPVVSYIAIWLMFYINITCGLALISQEKMIVKCIGLAGSVGLISTISAVFNATPRTYATSSETTRDCDFVRLLIFEMSEDGFEILNLPSICSSRFSICEYSFFDPSSNAFTVQIVSMHEICIGETDCVQEANNAIKNAGTRKKIFMTKA